MANLPTLRPLARKLTDSKVKSTKPKSDNKPMKTLSIGLYPEIGLQLARTRHDDLLHLKHAFLILV